LAAPLRLEILELCRKAGGKTLESSLLDELKSRGIEVTTTEMNAALIELEIHDKIRVTKLGKDRRMIEVVEPTITERPRSG